VAAQPLLVLALALLQGRGRPPLAAVALALLLLLLLLLQKVPAAALQGHAPPLGPLQLLTCRLPLLLLQLLAAAACEEGGQAAACHCLTSVNLVSLLRTTSGATCRRLSLQQTAQAS
jgi:hypothetical protein